MVIYEVTRIYHFFIALKKTHYSMMCITTAHWWNDTNKNIKIICNKYWSVSVK